MHIGVSSSGQDFILFLEEILAEHQGVRLCTAMMTDVRIVKVNGVGENYFVSADKDEKLSKISLSKEAHYTVLTCT